MKAQKYLAVFLGLALVLGLAMAPAAAVNAAPDATVTPASGGGAISADDYGTGAWTDLGSIVIQEEASTDFANQTGDVTINLTIPAGFEFNTTQAPDATKTGSDIASIVTPVGINASTITITYNVTDNSTVDNITIGGTTLIQVRPTAGTPLASGNILRTSGNPGTATVAGITLDTTNFGTLQEIHGAADHLITVSPAGSQTAGTAFLLTSITAYDQYGNVLDGANGATAYTGAKTLTFTGAATIGANVPTVENNGGTPVNFGSATTITFTAGVATIGDATGGQVVFYKAESGITIVADNATMAHVVASSGTPAFNVNRRYSILVDEHYSIRSVWKCFRCYWWFNSLYRG
jgi:hypothetical protein